MASGKWQGDGGVEVELKAVVAGARAVGARLLAAGAEPGFAGHLCDRRFDRDGELTARGEALRIRVFRGDDGRQDTVLGWKGPVSFESGYKRRVEREYRVAAADPVDGLLEALGFLPIHQVDRYVECYALRGAVLRLEWYPRMDCLIEVEGAPRAIEAAVVATGIDRGAFSADALTDFVARYEARTRTQAAVSLAELGDGRPGWDHREDF